MMDWQHPKTGVSKSKMNDAKSTKKLVFNPLEKVFPRKLTDPGKSIIIGDPANLISKGKMRIKREAKRVDFIRCTTPNKDLSSFI